MLVKEVLLMVLVMHTEEDDIVLHIVKTVMLMLVVEVDVGGMIADVVDKLTCSSDDVQTKQVDLRFVHALTELHWHDTHVDLDMHEVDQRRGSEDENPGSEKEDEEVAPKGQQRVDETSAPRIPVSTAWINPKDSTVYLDIKIDPRSCAPVQTPASPECLFGSLPGSPSSLVVPTLVASPATTPVASLTTTLVTTIAADEDEFLEVGAQIELYGSILYDNMQRLNALPPALFEGYDMNLIELYTRSREARDEIFSQRYRLRSLEQEQERATVTFGAIWRPVLALKSWAGYVDSQRTEMWRARYDDHRLIHDLLV
uniref:Uncharacterized protein n=1 Tax=Tanacetum cinerariifolium TaxID=118510 RepID=A0A6L2MFX6_TANCI|nr:hypothetical protein [Tanacetum cinerariifolium]